MGALNPVQLLYLEKDNKQPRVRLFSTFSFKKTKCFRLWLCLPFPRPASSDQTRVVCHGRACTILDQLTHHLLTS